MEKNSDQIIDPSTKENQQSSPDQDNEIREDKHKTKERKGSSETAIRENTDTDGYGHAQQKEKSKAGSVDADLDGLPNKSRISDDNQTGPGLG